MRCSYSFILLKDKTLITVWNTNSFDWNKLESGIPKDTFVVFVGTRKMSQIVVHPASMPKDWATTAILGGNAKPSAVGMLTSFTMINERQAKKLLRKQGQGIEFAV
jgi:hypothetical protein